ncbi:MAG: MerR family transcriptional regulator [Planctomycetia bacterium]|nr:MerR family transcriptional regulator [Planctomycetia bacterium]
MKSLRTGEVARLAGVNVETLRFYEREGILVEPPRRMSGYREYPPDTVDLIRFVKRAQELGFSLREIQELLNLRKVPRRATGKVPGLVRGKISEIDHKIRDLQAMRRALGELLGACEEKKSGTSCPIIASLSGCPECAETEK